MCAPARQSAKWVAFPGLVRVAHISLRVAVLAGAALFPVCPVVRAHTFDRLDPPAPAMSYKPGLSPLQYWTALAQQGSAHAQFVLAEMYAYGDSAPGMKPRPCGGTGGRPNRGRCAPNSS